MKMNQYIKTFIGIVALATTVTACSDDADELLQQAGQQEEGVSPFTRAPIDPTTLDDFRRTYGVGFSYDALYGEKCNMKDIRCQVIDYQAIKDSRNLYGEQLLRASKDNEGTISTYAYFSKSDYTQNSCFKGDAEGNLIIVNGKVEGTVSIWESGEVNKFYCESRYDAQAMAMELSHLSASVLVQEGHTELLTKNFREAIDWMAKHKGNEVVDSFLMRYGTHVVTRAKIGGCIKVNMTLELDSVLNVRDVKVLGDVSIGEMVKYNSQSENFKKELILMNKADCNVTIKGGDLSKIPNDQLHFTFGQRPKLDSYVSAWVATLNYDKNNVSKSNMELIDMDVEPIWEYIPNADVANRVKMRVVGTAEDMLKDLGYQNGVSTVIDLSDKVTCNMAGRSTTFQKPAMYNVIASGRYVATVCREHISEIEPNPNIDVLVVYPIYDRQVNLSSGYCIYGGKAYHVRNSSNGYYVEEDDQTVSEKIYLNVGVPSYQRYTNIDYQPSHNVIAYEWPYIINKDGSTNSSQPYYLTYKNKLKFFLRDTNGKEQSGKLDGIPNWSYDGVRYKRMVRDDDYHYYWNTKEISY